MDRKPLFLIEKNTPDCCQHSYINRSDAGTYKWWLEAEHGSDGECWVEAAEDGAEQHEFPYPHVDRQRRQVVAQRGQVLYNTKLK